MADPISHAAAWRFGAGVDDLRAAPREAIDTLHRAGFRHLELTAAGPLAPRSLPATGRRHLSRYLAGIGVELTALGVTAPRLSIDEQMDQAAAGIEMAGQVGADVVSVSLAHFGVRGKELKLGPSGDVLEALERLVDRADVTGRVLALDAGPLGAEATRELIRRLGHPAVRALVDPGRFIARGQDARAALLTLADHIGLARARDAQPGTPDHAGRETAVGDGAVDFEEYLALLRDFGYHRPTIIRRGASDRPVSELMSAREYLERTARRIAGP